MAAKDEIAALKAQIEQLTETAKQEALDAATAAVAALNDLGFPYQLVEGSSTQARSRKPAEPKADTDAAPRTSTRRTGIRDEVLKVIEENPGVVRASIITRLDAKGDKSAEQSVSNALSALKKAGTIATDGKGYKAR